MVSNDNGFWGAVARTISLRPRTAFAQASSGRHAKHAAPVPAPAEERADRPRQSASSRWGIPLVCVLAIMVACFLSATLHYDSNDDRAMQRILAGNYTGGEPSPYTIHSSIILGEALALLFRLSSSIPWWTLAQELLVALALVIWAVFSWGALEGLGLSRGPRRILSAIVVVVTGAFLFCRPFIDLSYTYTSAVLAGIACHVLLLRTAQPEGLGRRMPGIEVVLLTLSLMDRYMSGLIGLAFYVMLTCLLIVTGHHPRQVLAVGREDDVRREWSFSFRTLLEGLLVALRALLPILVIAIGLRFLNNYVYNQGEWEGFLPANSARAKYMDYTHPSYDDEPELYESVGWSRSLAALSEYVFYMDESVTPEAFRTLARQERYSVGEALSYLLEHLATTHKSLLYLLVIGCLSVIALGLAWKRPSRLLLLLALDAMLVVSLMYLAIRGRLILRSVYAPVFPVMASVLALCFSLAASRAHETAPHVATADGGRQRSSGRLFVAGAVGMLCLVVGLCGASFVVQRRHLRAEEQSLREKTAMYDARLAYYAQHPDILFVTMGSGDSIDDPWRTKMPSNMLMWGGWVYFSPLCRHLEDALGRPGFTDRDFVEDDVRIVTESPELAEHIRTRVSEVLGCEVDIELEEQLIEGLAGVYRYSIVEESEER